MNEQASASTLLDRWKAGDESAAAELYNRFAPQLLLCSGAPMSDKLRRRLILIESIKIDQQYRVGQGAIRPLEDYLREWPELLEDATTLISLLEAECFNRALSGDLPTRHELRRRFPELEPKVRLEAVLAECHSEQQQIASRNTMGSTPAGADTSPIPKGILGPAQREDELGRLAHYRILRVLGAGGMGIVFEAEDQRLGRHVALKTLRSDLASNPTYRERFLREARAAAKLNHDHVVIIHQVDEANGIPFFAMQLLYGETLEDRLRRERIIPITKTVRVAIELTDALSAAHDIGLIHRDIKPGNIWLEEKTGRAKLLDFGLAHFGGLENVPHAGMGCTSEDHRSDDLTRPDEQLGTAGYMAPELFLDNTSSAASDLFALGCVLYRCLSGKLPFHATNLLTSAIAFPPIAPHLLNSRCPQALGALIMSLLATHPGDRPQSGTVLAELERIHEGLTRKQQRTWHLIALAFMAAVATVVAVVVGLRVERPAPAVQFATARQYAVGEKPFDVAAEDFNSDSHPDLAVSTMDSRRVSILLGAGDGSFDRAGDLETNAEPMTLAVGDYNEDQQPDIAVPTLGNNSVEVFLGSGDGAFQRVGRRLEVGTQPRGLATADLDDDGHLDLVACGSSDHLTLWYGNGLGSFDSRQDYAVDRGGQPPSVAASDLNHDARLDLVVANGTTDTVSVLLAAGHRQFHPAVHYPVGSGPGMLALVDLDRDRNVDVAVENFGSNDVSILLGNGDGTFRQGGLFNAGTGPGGIEAADFNGDDRTDLIVANHLSHNVSVLLGRGDGSFLPPENCRVGETPVGIAVGDFDRDGRIDFAVANHNSNSISVGLNPPLRPHLRVALPLTLQSSSWQTFVVTALDSEDKILHDFRGAVRFTSDDPQAVLPEPYTFQATDDGNHTFRVKFATIGPHTLEAHCDSRRMTGGTVVRIIPSTDE